MRKGSALRALVVVALVVMTLPFASTRAAAACGAAGTPTTTIYLPNITKTLGGPSGWVTPFIVQNVGTTNTNLEVSFFRFSDGSLVTCRNVSALAPGTSFADFPNADTDLPADTQFAVVVKSFGASVVSVVNEHQRLDAPAQQEALSYVGLSSGATKAYIPYVAKFVNGWLTTFVVQNLGAAVANVSIAATSYDGTKTATLTRQIGPGRSAAIDPSVEPLLISGLEYAIVLSSDQPIAAIANAQNDAPGVAAPMGFSYNAVAQPLVAPAFVPAVSKNADGVGRTTRLLVENAGTADATPTLTFTTAAGAPTTVTAPAPVHAGSTWSYTPTGMADGTYALTVSGGAFAVVAASLTSTTAMGVTAQAGTGNRAYLPNITRTLGGANGWTTPIVLQSTGAISATIRWYRFSDGALILREPITGLVNGAAVTIDPRTRAALSDDTQYAVVVDATGGTIAAIVTELNFQGGDGAMGYEGFAATVSAFPVATALSVTPATASVIAGGTQQFTAAVKDQFDNALPGATVTWQVTPPTLGGISSTGLFTAGSAAGAGTVTATVGALSVNVAVNVQLPQTRTLGGFNFVVTSVNGADVFVQDSITGADRTTILTQAPADVAQVQLDFARTYSARPQIYVFATTTAFTSGLQSVLGLSATQASLEGPAATGLWVYNNTGQGIGLDWQKQAQQLPVTALRHELTHWMEHEIATPGVEIPTWFDEGNARAEEFTVANSDDLLVPNRYGAASMAATNTLFALSDMTTSTQWDARVGQGLAGSVQYYAAYAAVSFLRADLGTPGMRRLLELMAQGQTFEGAYATITGQPFTAFSSAYAQRVRLLAPSYPGVATANGTVRGPGMTIELYGFTPNAQVTIAITGAANAFPSVVTVNAYGTYATRLDSQFPTGSYTITVTWSGPTVTVQAAKASSIEMLSLDPGAVATPTLPAGE